MVHLYGVTYGGHWNDFLTGRTGEMKLSPTTELAADLLRFPKGTRVGFGFMTKKDWDEVRLHILTLPFNPPEPIFEDQSPAPQPYYREESSYYWDRLQKVCSDLGFEVLFLEDKNIWFRYNEAINKFAENEAVRSNLLVKEKGESQEQYDRKRIGFNMQGYKEDISARKIHEIDRDNQLLKAINSLGVNVAVVGIGHSEYWMANPQVIRSNFGICFESHSAEVLKPESPTWQGLTVFNKDAKPNPKMAFDRISLERTIKLLETGRLNERKPDFVGTWNIHNPFEGYFEMFIDKAKGFRGEIIDCNGNADFEGEINAREAKFVKRYRQNEHTEHACSKEIIYRAIVRNGNLMGYFVIDEPLGRFGHKFYATPEQVKDFVDLGMSWLSLSKRYRRGMKSLTDRLFNP